ncbi:MAG: putative addiction module antidote protein [Betaproteobacteria bacterium]|nr:putative addiction module antidote protein [Betaproteobacteria bacterium]
MTKTVTTRDDVAEHLRTPEEMAAYLEACFEEADGDAALLQRLGDIARAKGMSQVARDAGLFVKVFTKRSPVIVARLDTILKVIGALGAEVACRSWHS